jgi:hypothetical protein
MSLSNALAISPPSTKTCVLNVNKTDGLLIVGLLIAYRFIGLLGLVLKASLRVLLKVLLRVWLRVWFRVLLVEALVAGSLKGPFKSRVLVERLLSASFRLFASLLCIFL